MSLAVFEHVSLGFGKKTILQDLSLRIAADDRIGLIGPNGSGKTSLLRMLAGEQLPDGGTISFGRGTRVGYLPQDLELRHDKPLLVFVMESVRGRREIDEEIAAAEKELHEIERTTGDGDAMMAIAERLGDLHERAAHHEMHYTEHEALRILRGLGFAPEDRDRSLSELSGGWKMRAVLASLLFQKPDLLLLDEPTNHLDVPSVTWLGDFLAAYQRAFILICHDREFLNEQVRRIVSFEVEGVRQYSSDYEGYVKLREEEEVVLENKAKNLARVRADAERFINRFRAQANKASAVQSRVKALDKMEDVETYQRRKVMRIQFPPVERSVAEPLRLDGIGKRFGDHTVLGRVSLTVQRGERIAIMGVNGAGKTTLLRMIAGELEPSEGKVALGPDVKVGYYAQHHAEALHKASTIYQEVASLDPSKSPTRIRGVLGAFLFEGDDVEKKISVLSGGERARVALARLLINPGNLLLMDEPTNHLDLASSEALAESLSKYDGTLVFVSHNRSFVRRLATRIWNVADGTVETYPGTLDEYMDTCRRRQALEDGGDDPPKASQPAKTKVAAGPGKPPGDRAKSEALLERQKLKTLHRKSKQLAKEIATLESRITTLEAAQKERSALLADPDVYADRERSGPLLVEFREAQAEIERLTARWESANAEHERAESALVAASEA